EVLLFSRGANIQEAVILEKIFSRWKSRAQPAEDVAAELKALLDSPDTAPEQKLQLLLDNCLVGRRTILILDTFEDVQTDADGAQQQAIVSETLRAFIRHLLQNSPPDCHVLFTTRYAITGLDGLVTHLKLDKLTYAEQYRYLNFSPTLRQIPLAERDLLHRRFDGHPRALQFLEGLLAKAPATDLSTLVKQAEGQIFENLLLGRIYDRLTAQEREVFTVASVFSNRSTQAALGAVLPIDPAALAPVITALRDWSLCFWDETAQVFEVHALTREWMRKQGHPTLDRFKTISHQLGVYYQEQPTWEDEILAKGYFEQAEAWEEYADTAFRLEDHYRLIGLYPLARDLNVEVLERNISLRINAHARNSLGVVHFSQGQYAQALTYYQQNLVIAQEIGDRSVEGAMLNNIGSIYSRQGQYMQALTYYQQNLVIAQEIGDWSSEGVALNNIGSIYSRQGQYEQALTYYQQSLAIAQEIGDRSSEGATLSNIGDIYRRQGQYEQALTYYQQSLAIAQEIGDRSVECRRLNDIGLIYKRPGQYEQALTYYQQSLAIAQEIGDWSSEGVTLGNIGIIYLDQGQYEQALTYLELSLANAQEIGDLDGIATAASNLGAIYFEQYLNVEKAIPLFMRAYHLFTEMGSPNANAPENYLNAILTQIGEERFMQIIQSNQTNSQS
uniref:tetratricopeptide repeat protein n=1 Tax=Persicitalea sp. TaxID=3100273 RepID=UPI00359324A4